MRSVVILWCILFCAFCSCSDDPDYGEVNEVPGVPELIYWKDSITQKFYVEGEAWPKVLVWKGDVGRVYLEESYTGIGIDESDGTIRWAKNITEGVYNLHVIAENKYGKASDSIYLEILFEGRFGSLFNDNANDLLNLIEGDEYYFEDTGVLHNGKVWFDGSKRGDWKVSGNVVKGSYYQSAGGEDEEDVYYLRSFIADMIRSDNTIKFSGVWFEGEEIKLGEEAGRIEFYYIPEAEPTFTEGW